MGIVEMPQRREMMIAQWLATSNYLLVVVEATSTETRPHK